MSHCEGRILIADDDDTFLQTISALLHRERFDCDCVYDATGAAALLSEKMYDLLIADIQMPGNEGLELIRQQPQIAEGLPVILVTGHPTIATAIDSIHLAVTGYVTKPVEFADLLVKVREAISAYRALQVTRRIGKQLERWRSETALLEKSLRAKSGTSVQDALEALARLAYGRAVETISEARRAGAPVKPFSDAECTIVGCARLNLCVHALKDTVAVLRKTRESFKSKELGALRQRLEEIICNLDETDQK